MSQSNLMSPSTTTFPFYIVSAFSSGPFQGNPAAVLFIDSAPIEPAVLQRTATNFVQPMLSVVGAQRETSDSKIAAFDISWFTTSQELPANSFCGHGTIAAVRAIFERGLVGEGVETIEFRTKSGATIRACRVGENSVQIRVAGGVLTELAEEKKLKATKAIFSAFGREVDIKYLGVGSGPYEIYLVVELDEKEDLGNCQVNIDALRNTGYLTNVFTTTASGARGQFVSRMFSPATLPAPHSEDAVCGSAHGLLVPYWSLKNDLKKNEPLRATQVSSRGGQLDLLWDGDAVGLTGETFVMLKGEIYLQ
ncbi:hypothetical protein FB45DRAFT_847452 [Roridomyces roridus]|uniref:Diaminopimelate epimerase-like protein n=1 Tax=Roridomyces roridus TaxID=1738132 RepID=A0AAD7F7F7_9AGAR|nr:hypothetical protein FB45DRAFT_847452 [Roridomyces roridus]